MDIETKVVNVIADMLDKDVSDINVNSNIMSDLGADSLDTVELIMTFEEEFDVVIYDEDSESIKTVGDAVRVITDLVSQSEQNVV